MAKKPENEEMKKEEAPAESQEEKRAAAPEGDKEEAKADSGSVSLKDGLGGVLGVKAGMTQIYNDAGSALAVTVIDLNPNVITQIKTLEKNGYQGVQVGMLPKKEKHTTKAEQGHLKASGGNAFYHYNEFRLPKEASMDGIKVGQELDATFLSVGDLIDVTSTSKGKGFQGVMKRHHFHGACRSHGVSITHRMGGSIGNRTDPGKVVKNTEMAGHMGNRRVTIQNMRVARVDLENKLLLVHGSVPGPKSGVVKVQRAVKDFQTKQAQGSSK